VHTSKSRPYRKAHYQAGDRHTEGIKTITYIGETRCRRKEDTIPKIAPIWKSKSRWKTQFETDLGKCIGCECIDLFQLIQDRVKRWIFVNTLMNIWVPYQQGISGALSTVNFQRRTMYNGDRGESGSPGHGVVSDTRFLIMVADSDMLQSWHWRTLFSLSLTDSVISYPQECRRYARSCILFVVLTCPI
jgi:hypothetical protein